MVMFVDVLYCVLVAVDRFRVSLNVDVMVRASQKLGAHWGNFAERWLFRILYCYFMDGSLL